jgi:hypothetical protein
MVIPPEKKCTANTSAFQDEGERIGKICNRSGFCLVYYTKAKLRKAIFKYVLEKEKPKTRRI